jgi:hypothetical protein
LKIGTALWIASRYLAAVEREVASSSRSHISNMDPCLDHTYDGGAGSSRCRSPVSRTSASLLQPFS